LEKEAKAEVAKMNVRKSILEKKAMSATSDQEKEDLDG